jgi:hypothetical protein
MSDALMIFIPMCLLFGRIDPKTGQGCSFRPQTEAKLFTHLRY